MLPLRHDSSQGWTDASWCVATTRGQPPVRVPLAANDQLRPLSISGDVGAWESIGGTPRFELGLEALDRPVGAGWYVLQGKLEMLGDGIALPSVCVSHGERSALDEAEWVLPETDRFGRIRMLLLFLDDVASLRFSPGMGAMRFRMEGFSLRRVSRFRALRMMLGGSRAASSTGRAGRMQAWIRALRCRGLRRATDELYAGYRGRMWPRGMDPYALWVRKYDPPRQAVRDARSDRTLDGGSGGTPRISVLLCIHESRGRHLRRCLDSLLEQSWRLWELCAVVDATADPDASRVLAEYAARDPRIRSVARSAADPAADPREQALAAARGDYVALLDQNDEWHALALQRVVAALADDPDVAVVYADEDRVDAAGHRREPEFKPDWNLDLLRARNYIGRFVVVRGSVLREAGGFRSGFDDGADHDMILRCCERVRPRQIRHLPEILCHVHATDEPAYARHDHPGGVGSVRAVEDHLERIGITARVGVDGLPAGHCRVRWPLPRPVPAVSIIIPTRNHAGLLRRCVESILQRSTYPHFELVVVDNRSDDRGALRYLAALARREHVKVLRYDKPFNFSAINNWAVRQSSGALLALVNNDIEVITPDWMEEMAGFAVRPDTGAVGAMLYYPCNAIQHAGMVLGIGGVAGHVYAGKPRGYDGDHGRARVAQNLSAVTGACLMVRRELFDAAGGLDERLPVEFNDVDFCLRLRELGYRNTWTPFAELYHHESASRAIEDDAARRLRATGIAWMLDRWRHVLRDDPAYNPNLSLQGLDCEPAFPPRERK